MTRRLKPGDKVAWDTARGETKGAVEKKLTTETRIMGHTAKPSESDPQYLVRSDRTGKEAAHKLDELKKR